MLRILFSGSSATQSWLKDALTDFALLVQNNEDLRILEIQNEYDLKRATLSQKTPLFLIVSTVDKKVLERLRGLQISGIFLQPLKKDLVVQKIESFMKTYKATVQSDEMFKVKLLAKAESMPALPFLAQKLLNVSYRDKTSLSLIAEQLKQDQGISSRVIKLVNSPFYGYKQDINSIDRAVVILGMDTVKNVALVASTNSYYEKNFSMYKTTGSALWEHAYKTALISELLAKKLNVNYESLFLAGLMHDIGKTIMVDFLVKEVSNCEDEVEQLGMDHAEAAGLILKRWQFPQDIIDMVRLHHHLDTKTENKIVYFANKLAHTSGSALDFEQVMEEMKAHFVVDLTELADRIKQITEPSFEE